MGETKVTGLFLGKRFRYNPNYRNTNLSYAAIESLKRVKDSINSGAYGRERHFCFCGSNNEVSLAQMDWFGSYYPLVICKECGIMRVNPRMTKNSYINFYKDEYRTLYGDNDWNKDELYELRIQQAQEVYIFINKYARLNKKSVVFDIGCNMGTMLVPFQKDGCEVMGVDYGAEYIELGREKTGIPLEVGGVEKLNNYGKNSDLVILNHVCEHFLDLEKELINIREVMKPDSFIFVALPGTFWWIKNKCAGNILGLLQNAHIWQFSLNSLRYAMECCGFELIYGDEEIKAIFKKSNAFRDKKDLPQDEFAKVMVYLKGVERNFLPKVYLARLLQICGLKEIVKNITRKSKHNKLPREKT